MLSVGSDSVTSWTNSLPGSSVHGQEYWSGLPFPPPGDLPHPGTESASPESSALAGGLFTFEPPGKPLSWRLPDSLFTTPDRAKMRLTPQLNIH